MKKIGIITILNVNNYGAELQAFALHHKLKLLGYENEVINYLYYKNPEHRSEIKSLPLFKRSVYSKLKEFALKWLDRYSALSNPRIAKVRKRRFSDFHSKYTCMSQTYRSYSELYNAKHPYDIFIVGSDQVWNPNNHTSIEPYYLTFAPKNAKKISYASSFGVGSIDKAYHETYATLLNNLDFISTRESDGVKIIKDISGKDAVHVLDPTLLLSRQEWTEVLEPFESSEPYILLFVFKDSPYVKELALHLKRQTGFKIIRVCKNEMRVEPDSEILNIRDMGPREFLGLYQNAAIVITTSFHGTIFSLIFEKPFYTITPGSKNNNSRQQSLLSMVGLNDRLIEEGRPFVELPDLVIDYVNVKKILEQKRTASLAYLEEAINK
ncbi:polysaccharide pyruvyl transferase family protein [Mucilaginibacter limnophilus]|uniref:Polysaccharide pyruvyl transferase family protein n=1 Tax=Mucilaginibacter limnophilus TaxID=1932778 RepID=A0A437MQ44_9SPHI|nr:polysaccharide pyruvyl transferase family protein [Mucilaginibacter limnophilus]RVT99757.1 polysaccharide pyruvyl transferase family protein [Mucilaginibacter limnophilus]